MTSTNTSPTTAASLPPLLQANTPWASLTLEPAHRAQANVDDQES
jgi:hypothetical protein